MSGPARAAHTPCTDTTSCLKTNTRGEQQAFAAQKHAKKI
jgi:hypothetical protein